MSRSLDAWIDAVLQTHKSPAWLLGDSPYSDVVVSTRARLMRNIAGLPFPNACSPHQLEAIKQQILRAAPSPPFEVRTRISEAERALLVGSRLIAPAYMPNQPGRCVLLSDDRTLAIMVNEEDHLRIQAVTAGLSLETADAAAQAAEQILAQSLEFAKDREFGYLAASFINLGAGLRLGVMLHLPGLVAAGTSKAELDTLCQAGCEVRGVMGEATLGTGAYLQISTTGTNSGKLSDHIRHLILRERSARAEMHDEVVEKGIAAALSKIEADQGLTLATATRSIGWLRLGALRGLVEQRHRRLDELLTLVCFDSPDDEATNRRRGHLIRRFLRHDHPIG